MMLGHGRVHLPHMEHEIICHRSTSEPLKGKFVSLFHGGGFFSFAPCYDSSPCVGVRAEIGYPML